ncbi:hypothetical protein A9Q87_12985 [Flavobacteriales bacterium 34_180_T64]|nr:hypothetical protein A9Q87_12985 [Flavobacteriales bacterium 34_180_T64]
MTKKEIALKYLEFLENGNIMEVVNLFREDAIIDSPIYGIMNVKAFYQELNSDTTNSELKFLGLFEDNDTHHIALYFNYKWTLKNHQNVEFDVVDVIEFDTVNKISRLKIIYDTVTARKIVEQLEY